ncbi:MAG: HPr family phosphocarrier protein [Eubacteriales bacterium]|nr:HPr family phosphocarrier protein [Eubacteriales bacterium]
MKEFEYIITDPDGIHARPAGELVKAAREFSCTIQLVKNEKAGDCKKIFSIMGLGVKKGDKVMLLFDGEDEDRAFSVLSSFMQEKL